jgi:hypothetical protein
MLLNKKLSDYMCTYYQFIHDYTELPYAKFRNLKRASAALRFCGF